MKPNKIKLNILFPVLFSFFVMGFADMVGISVSYVKNDFGLNDKLSNLIPMMVFLWFAVFSLPTGKLMGRIGRKKTVLLSASITTLAMIIPFFHYSFPLILFSFALLGIGNTILQVSLNPLLAGIVPSDRVTGMLALGQFIKAVSATLAPIMIGLAAVYLGDWKYIFPAYCIITIISWIWLFYTNLEDKKTTDQSLPLNSLFHDKYIMMMFSVIILIVGFEIGLLTAVPKYLSERFSLTLERGGFACSLYYTARTIGTLAGAFFLSRISIKKFQIVTLSLAVLSLICFMCANTSWLMFLTLFIIGLTCANVFASFFAASIKYKPSQANEISALMITGVAGGAFIPPVMGVIADSFNQTISLVIPLIALVYILIISFRLRE